jgi:hypothetical protein
MVRGLFIWSFHFPMEKGAGEAVRRMKWAIGLILVVAGGAVGTAFLTMDAAGAGAFAFATLVVVVLGAAPVVFGVLTRRVERRARRGPRPTVIRSDGHETGDALGTARVRKRRGHRRLKR